MQPSLSPYNETCTPEGDISLASKATLGTEPHYTLLSAETEENNSTVSFCFSLGDLKWGQLRVCFVNSKRVFLQNL